MSEQPLHSKKGEVEFRRRLVASQTGAAPPLADEFDAPGIEAVLRSRMASTLQHMSALRASGVPLSPYLEIGAERCQRALVLENDLDGRGAAADLSFDMLRSCEHYQQTLGKPRAPLRVCCDIEALPFLTGSLRFAFCYQTLHHFPDPGPALREVERVLAAGAHFYFDEEPYRKIAHLPLYRRKVYARGTLASSRLRRRLDYFFAREINNETDYGIVENDSLSVGTWRRALSVFAERDIKLTTIRGLSTDLFRPSSRVRHLLCVLLGGTISGLCRKGGAAGGGAGTLREALACPACRASGRDHALADVDGGFACPGCGARFPVRDGVAFLLPPRGLEQLYPELSATLGDGGRAGSLP